MGPGGVVDVKSFTASTQNLTNQEFIGGGEFLYKGDRDASIENLGVIRASGGDAVLIAREIRNSGKIIASGLVGLTAGSEALIRPAGEERIFIQTDTRKAGKISQTREATLAAASAEIRATGNLYATAINLDGLIAVNEGSRKLLIRNDEWCRSVSDFGRHACERIIYWHQHCLYSFIKRVGSRWRWISHFYRWHLYSEWLLLSESVIYDPFSDPSRDSVSAERRENHCYDGP